MRSAWFCALAVYALFERRTALRRWHRAFALVVAISCIAIFLEPIVRMGRAYVHRNGQFPVLADFHSRIELYWTLSIGVNREIVDDALEVEFGAEEFPGVSFHEPVPDWRRYKTLVIDVENPGDAEPLEARRARARPPSQSHVQRPLQPEFRTGRGRAPHAADPARRHPPWPRQRLMDMAHISDITLFQGRSPGSRQLRVYSLRLE